jgi:hypothetical protein
MVIFKNGLNDKYILYSLNGYITNFVYHLCLLYPHLKCFENLLIKINLFV